MNTTKILRTFLFVLLSCQTISAWAANDDIAAFAKLLNAEIASDGLNTVSSSDLFKKYVTYGNKGFQEGFASYDAARKKLRKVSGVDIESDGKSGIGTLVVVNPDGRHPVCRIVRGDEEASKAADAILETIAKAVDEGFPAVDRKCVFPKPTPDLQQKMFVDAVRKNNVKQIKTLLKMGANVNATSADGDTPLHAAMATPSLAARTEELAVLIAAGANVNATNNKGDTPLHLAAFSGASDKTITALIAAGANVNAVNQSGYTPLMNAVREGPRLIALLLKSGANPNARPGNHESALQMAVDGYDYNHNHDLDVIKLLVEHGADTRVVDDKGRTLINEIMRSWPKEDMKPAVRYLAQHGVSLQDTLTQLVQASNDYFAYNDDDLSGIQFVASLMEQRPAVSDAARKAAVQARTALAQASGTKGLEEAANGFERATILAPWWADAYFNEGVVLEKLGKFDEAKTALKRYLIMVPDAADALKVKDKIYELGYRAKKRKEAENYVNEGAKYYNAGMNAEAISAYKQAIEADPDIGLAHANLGVCYHKDGRYQEAIVELKEGLSKGAREGYIYDSLGKIYHTLGNRKKAIATLEQGQSEGDGSNSAVLSATLCRYYEEDGRYEKALINCESARLFAKYLESDKDIDLNDIKRRIQRLKARLGQ